MLMGPEPWMVACEGIHVWLHQLQQLNGICNSPTPVTVGDTVAGCAELSPKDYDKLLGCNFVPVVICGP